MRHHVTVLVALATASRLFASGCGDRAHGPCAIGDRGFSAVAGRAVDVRLPLDAKGDGSGKSLWSPASTEFPKGLTLSVEGADLHVTGALAAAGSCAYGIVRCSRAWHSACEAWGAYHVTLDVAAP